MHFENHLGDNVTPKNRGVIVDKKPTVSIIMAAYNSQRYIGCSIDSVLDQTFPDWELIVIDDGSTDETVDIVNAYARMDGRIRLERTEVNSGVAVARNRGLDTARGRYIAFLDSDDIWLPGKLQSQLALAEQTRANLIYSGYSIIDDSGNKIREDYPVPEELTIEKLLQENVIGCSTVLLSAEVAKELRFDPSCYHEDYLLWLQMLMAGYHAVGCRQALAYWRYTSGSRSFNKCKSAYNRWRVYRKHLRMPVMACLRYFVLYSFAGMWKYREMNRKG